MAKIVGIDASLTGTGVVGLGYGPKPVSRHIASGQFGVLRLIEIRDVVKRLIRDADLVVLEGYSFGSQGRAIFQTGELGGVLRVLIHEAGKRLMEVAPTQVKKFVTGSGGAKKETIILAVYKRWGMEFKYNDEADALTLCYVGQAVLDTEAGVDPKLTLAQQETVRAVMFGKKGK